jgi:hypothetical protein
MKAGAWMGSELINSSSGHQGQVDGVQPAVIAESFSRRVSTGLM